MGSKKTTIITTEVDRLSGLNIEFNIFFSFFFSMLAVLGYFVRGKANTCNHPNRDQQIKRNGAVWTRYNKGGVPLILPLGFIP